LPVTVLDLAAVAEPALGEELAKLEMNAGGRPETTGSMMLPVSAAPRLADLGISKTQSSRWQAIARMVQRAGAAGLPEMIGLGFL